MKPENVDNASKTSQYLFDGNPSLENSTAKMEHDLLSIPGSNQNYLGAALDESMEDSIQKVLGDITVNSDQKQTSIGTSIAYVPVAFPAYSTSYVPHTVYGYVPNGLSPFPMYSYNPSSTDKDKEIWAAANNYSSRLPWPYLSFGPQSWNAMDGKNQSINKGVFTNGMIPGNGTTNGFQNSSQMTNPASLSQGSFIYQNGNSNSSMVKPINDLPIPQANILGNLLGPELAQASSNGLNGIFPNGTPQIAPNELLIPQSVQANHNPAMLGHVFPNKTVSQNGVLNGIHNLTMANGVPLMVSHGIPTMVTNPILSDGIPIGLPNGIPTNLPNGIPQNVNMNPGISVKHPGLDPNALSRPLDGANFVNLHNDVIFDPLTQTPILWNHLTRTPLMVNPIKENDMTISSLPREMQPPHFLNVYPITGVPMPTLIAASPLAGKPKKSFIEDPSKNRKYACKYCSKRFSRPSSLQTHTYTHTGERPFPCTLPNCGRSFSVLSNLRRHLHVCQKNLSKRLQLNEYLQRSTTNEPAKTDSIECSSPKTEKTNDSLPEIEPVPDQIQVEKPTSSSNDAASSSNGSNSDTRSTDSGSEETKNDSGIGGSVSSKGSRRAESTGIDASKNKPSMKIEESRTSSKNNINVNRT